jgi:hypothetical protein
MGISTHYYTVYGVQIDESNEKFQEFLDIYVNEGETDTPTQIWFYDYEKVVLGRILFDSGDLRWDDLVDKFVEIDLNTLTDIEAEYKQEFISKFPQFESLVGVPFKLMTFVNYS